MGIDLLSRFEGAILGLAIGDALGFPTEFISLKEIRTRYGPAGVTDFEPVGWHPPGTYTDDTQMSIAVAEALIEAGHDSIDKLMPAMARRFVAWSKSAENDRAPGTTCLTGCRNLASGAPWARAGVADSKGCGTAMRVAPIGLFYWKNEQRLVDVARASALPTHGHPTGVAAAAAAALLVAWAVRGGDPLQYPARLLAALQDIPGSDEVIQRVARIDDCLADHPDDVLRGPELGEGWVAEEAVACALYCFCRTPTDYSSTVLTGANTVGDSDSIASIAGAISGAYNGLGAIPEPWVSGVENSDGLRDLARRLHAQATTGA